MAATVKTRIQLKYDTEEHWNRAVNFCPLKGEVIIYSTDDTHPFCRLKVGDGETKVTDLPFIFMEGDVPPADLNFVLREHFIDFPRVGKANLLYIEAATNTIYKWTDSGGYDPCYSLVKETASQITGWNPGQMTNLSVDDGTATLQVVNGTGPSLTFENKEVAASFGVV